MQVKTHIKILYRITMNCDSVRESSYQSIYIYSGLVLFHIIREV